MSENETTILQSIRKANQYELSPGGVVSDVHLAAFLQTTTRRRVVEQLIYPDDCDGVPCVTVGSRFLIRVDALAEWMAENEHPQDRPRKKGNGRQVWPEKNQDPLCETSE